VSPPAEPGAYPTELKEWLFILGRGSYSASNLSTLPQAGINFIIPLSSAVKVFSALLSTNRRKFSDLNNSFVFGDEVLFHVQATVEINQIILEKKISSGTVASGRLCMS
jgi:hypothetical protein